MTDTSSFLYGDTAIGSAGFRNHVEVISRWRRLLPPWAKDVYSTPMLFTEDLLAYVQVHRNKNGNPSVEDYAGDGLLTAVHFDLDAKDWAVALADLRRLVQGMEDRYGLGEAVRPFFTGGKGFCASIPLAPFGGPLVGPCREIADAHKRLAASLVEGLGITTMDTSVYDAMRLWREPNTRHGKTGLHKIPLATTEVMELTPDLIARISRREPDRTVAYPDESEWNERPSGVVLRAAAINPPPAPAYRPSAAIRKDAPDATTQERALAVLANSWAKVGDRHAACRALSGGLLRAGWDEEATTNFVTVLVYATMETAEADERVGKGEFADLVENAQDRLDQGKETPGWPQLASFIGEDTTTEVRELLGLWKPPPDKAPYVGSDDPAGSSAAAHIAQILQELAEANARADRAEKATEEHKGRLAYMEKTILTLTKNPDDDPEGLRQVVKDQRVVINHLRTALDTSLLIHRTPGAKADLTSALFDLQALTGGLPTDEYGAMHLSAKVLAEMAATNENAAAEGTKLLARAGVTRRWTARHKPESEHTHTVQQLIVEPGEAFHRLQTIIRQRTESYTECRGRSRGKRKIGEPKPEPVSPAHPCLINPEHTIDAVCREDGEVVVRNIKVVPWPVKKTEDATAAALRAPYPRNPQEKALRDAWEEEFKAEVRRGKPYAYDPTWSGYAAGSDAAGGG